MSYPIDFDSLSYNYESSDYKTNQTLGIPLKDTNGSIIPLSDFEINLQRDHKDASLLDNLPHYHDEILTSSDLIRKNFIQNWDSEAKKKYKGYGEWGRTRKYGELRKFPDSPQAQDNNDPIIKFFNQHMHTHSHRHGIPKSDGSGYKINEESLNKPRKNWHTHPHFRGDSSNNLIKVGHQWVGMKDNDIGKTYSDGTLLKYVTTDSIDEVQYWKLQDRDGNDYLDGHPSAPFEDRIILYPAHDLNGNVVLNLPIEYGNYYLTNAVYKNLNLPWFVYELNDPNLDPNNKYNDYNKHVLDELGKPIVVYDDSGMPMVKNTTYTEDADGNRTYLNPNNDVWNRISIFNNNMLDADGDYIKKDINEYSGKSTFNVNSTSESDMAPRTTDNGVGWVVKDWYYTTDGLNWLSTKPHGINGFHVGDCSRYPGGDSDPRCSRHEQGYYYYNYLYDKCQNDPLCSPKMTGLQSKLPPNNQGLNTLSPDLLKVSNLLNNLDTRPISNFVDRRQLSLNDIQKYINYNI